MRKSQTGAISPRKGVRTSNNLSKSVTFSKNLRNSSDFSPIQQFQMMFNELEGNILRLRQLNPPTQLNSFFEDFKEYKNNYSLFVDNANKVLRHIKLGDKATRPLPNEPYDLCSSFSQESSSFLGGIVHLNSIKISYFEENLSTLFEIMTRDFDSYAALCMKNHQSRVLSQSYRTWLSNAFQNVENHLNELFRQSDDFSQVTINIICEELKAIARKFEVDLPHALHMQRLMLNEGDEYLSSFHNQFVKFVPLLSSVPNFTSVMFDIMDIIPRYDETLTAVLNQMKIPVSRSPTPLSVTRESPAEIPDGKPFDHSTATDKFVAELLPFLNLEKYSRAPQDSQLELIAKTIKKKITKLEQDNHKLSTQINATEFITNERVLNERIEENKKFQEAIRKDYQKKRAGILQDTITTVKKLIDTEIIDKESDFETQVETVVAIALSEKNELKKFLANAEKEISDTKEVIAQFNRDYFALNVDMSTNIVKMAQTTIESVMDVQRELDQKLVMQSSSNSELNFFLKQLLSTREPNVDSMPTNQMKSTIIHILETQENDLKEAHEKINQFESINENNDDKIIECMSKIQSRLENLTDNAPQVTSTSFEIISENISDLLSKFEEQMKKAVSFRRFLQSFLAQLLFALHLPQVKLKDSTDAQLKDVMTSIIDAPSIQKNLSSFEGRPKATQVQTARNLEPVKPVTITTKDTDKQFTLQMHNFLAEILAIMNNKPTVGFIHLPIDQLMKQIRESIRTVIKFIKNIRGLLADVQLRVKPGSDSKENLMTANIDDIATVIFTELDTILTEKNKSITAILPELVNSICEPDRQLFSSMKISQVEMIRQELQKMKKTYDFVEPINQIIEDLNKNMCKERKGFSPNSPYFNRFIELVEQMRRCSLRLNPSETHPSVYPILSHGIELFDLLSTALSAVTIAPELEQNIEKAGDLLRMKKEDEIEFKGMKDELDKKNLEIEQVKQQFLSYIEANHKEVEEHNEAMAQFHNNEIQSIVDYFTKSDSYNVL